MQIKQYGRFILAGGIVAIALFAVAFVGDSRSVCVQADEWVSRRAGQLPTTLDRVVAFPRAYQRRIFAALPADAKARLWHERLNRILEQPLTQEQRDVARDAFLIVTPQLYEGGVVPESWLARRERAFSASEARNLFETLGPVEGYATLDSMTVLLRARISELTTVGAAPSCNCSDDGHCPSEYFCNIEVCNVIYGCGPFGTSACGDGVCRPL